MCRGRFDKVYDWAFENYILFVRGPGVSSTGRSADENKLRQYGITAMMNKSRVFFRTLSMQTIVQHSIVGPNVSIASSVTLQKHGT